jgi:2-polyprenyl-3-methyl-5-hydroxy-6-metoxy-1,4-benzoquinol methylase
MSTLIWKLRYLAKPYRFKIETSNMTNSKELVKKQYDRVIYPNIPIEKSFKNAINLLFIHSIIPPHYLRFQEVISSTGKLILDVGCGSGFTSLLLAEANPGAKIIGVDISEPSVEMARKRLLHHHYNDTEFHAIDIQDLPNLGLSFDYINCNDTLYLLPDPISALKSMQSVLSQQGTIRANLHDLYARERFLRSQQLWKFLGLMDDAPDRTECDIVREIVNSLQDTVIMKSQAWLNVDQGSEPNEFVFMNHLFHGDCGFTISQMFEMLNASNLEFISMVNWKHWDLDILFDDKQNILAHFDAILSSNSEEPKLYVYELLNPIDRQLDFWCGHPGQRKSYISADNWDDSIWIYARVFLNPYLKLDRVRSALDKAIASFTPFKISEFFSQTTIEPVSLSTQSAIYLRMAWDRPITFDQLVKQWLRIKPLNLLTLEPMTEAEAFAEIKRTLIEMEAYMFVMLERSH